jgi:hypothetical protein
MIHRFAATITAFSVMTPNVVRTTESADGRSWFGLSIGGNYTRICPGQAPAFSWVPQPAMMAPKEEGRRCKP